MLSFRENLIILNEDKTEVIKVKLNINKFNVSIIIAVVIITDRMDYISSDTLTILNFTVFAAGLSMFKGMKK